MTHGGVEAVKVCIRIHFYSFLLFLIFFPSFCIDDQFQLRIAAQEEKTFLLPAIVISTAHPYLDPGIINTVSTFIILTKA